MRFDAKRVLNKCNANISETIVYEVTDTTGDGQQRVLNVDSVDEFKFLNLSSQQATITDYKVTYDPGYKDENGRRTNSTITIDWLFFANSPQDLLVTFVLKYEVVGLLKEDEKHRNYIVWRPFAGNFLDDTTSITNATVTVNLPWGSQTVLAPGVLGAGYNITTGLSDAVIVWRSTLAAVVFSQSCYVGDPDYEFKVEMSFDRQAALCNKFPPWMYVVLALAMILSVLIGCSLLAFLVFERPYQFLVAVSADRQRVLELDLEEEEDEEEDLIQAAEPMEVEEIEIGDDHFSQQGDEEPQVNDEDQEQEPEMPPETPPAEEEQPQE